METQVRADIMERLQSIKSLQTQPAVIAKISHMLQNPATNADELGQVIKTDQVLTSSVLRLVNSAFYGLPGRVGSISHAIVLLGFSTVKNIALTASMLELFKANSKTTKFSTRDFYQHSLACAVISQHLAHTLGHEQKEECFVAGLIHDIGKIIMLQMLSVDFIRVVNFVDKTKTLFYESETKLVGLTHQDIGGMLVEQWRLPKHIQCAVESHHNPPSGATVAQIVHCADIFARALGYGNGGDRKIPIISDVAWNELKLGNMNMLNLFNSIDKEWWRAKSCFQLP